MLRAQWQPAAAFAFTSNDCSVYVLVFYCPQHMIDCSDQYKQGSLVNTESEITTAYPKALSCAEPED